MLSTRKVLSFALLLGLAALASAGVGHAADPGFLSAAALGLAIAPAVMDARGVERQEGAWRILPLEGSFQLFYEDVNGFWSVRRVLAHELKVGPGKVLLGGTDLDLCAYRGFRADRIQRLVDLDDGSMVERNILDWLMRRAERTRKERLAEARRLAKAA